LRILLAFRCFSTFPGASGETLTELNLAPRDAAPKPAAKAAAAPAAAPAVRTSDGALQLLGILQRDSRLVDFLMEDIASYSDDQVGAAVRELHDQCAIRCALCETPARDRRREEPSPKRLRTTRTWSNSSPP
jgi:hypothetical protein